MTSVIDSRSADPAPRPGAVLGADSNDKRPLWLLDFDGVLNAISKRGMNTGWHTWNTASVKSPLPGEDNVHYPLLWASETVQAVADAHDAGVRVVWLTTWREHTALLPPLMNGLPSDLEFWDEDTVLAAGGKLDPMLQLNQQWKYDTARQLVPDGVPVLWTDDNLPYILRKGARWASSRPGGTTSIAPTQTLGLSKRQTFEVNEWVRDAVR